MLIIAAGNQQDFLGEQGQHPRNDPGGAGGDGIVVILYAAQLPDEFRPVLHAGKGLRHAADGLGLHVPPHGGDGGHVVFHVVPAGDADLADGQQGLAMDVDSLPVAPDAALHRGAPAEHPAVPPHLGGEGGGNLVAGV